MSEQRPAAFKEWIDEAAVRRIADALRAQGAFDADSFVSFCMAALPDLELKQRVARIAEGLRAHVPEPYPEALERLLGALGPPLTTTEGITESFDVWPFCHFVEAYGLEHPDASFRAMVELTQRFSAEFAVRPYLVRDLRGWIARLYALTEHENPHVRRWVSEGTRPRLPWGIRLQALVADPAPIIPLLEALRNDPEEYVRRSVANSLNDIAKDHPDRVVDLCAAWWPTADANGRRLIRHALRTLLKAGHPGALQLLGFGSADLELQGFVVQPVSATIGGDVSFSAVIASRSAAAQRVMLDYAIHFRRADGGRSRKVFKWTTRTIGAGEVVSLERRHSLKIVTTRRFYPGPHAIELIANGHTLGTVEFELRAPGS